MTQLRLPKTLILLIKAFFLLLAISQPAWSTLYVHWSDPQLPPAASLGVVNIVFTWRGGISPILARARKQGYSVYVETAILDAKAAADEGVNSGWAGIILDIPESEGVEFENRLAELRNTYPNFRFLPLSRGGKQPDMRGSLIVKRNSVLEVSSPTAQPWIDSNLALIKVEQRSRRAEVPVYAFSWDDQRQPRTLSADDYSLAVAEMGAFHADLVLPLDEQLQQGLNNHDANAWALWNQVKSTLTFCTSNNALHPAANVAVALDRLDPSDEVLNLLGRHNIPYKVFLAEDLKAEELEGFAILLTFAKPDRQMGERIKDLAARGKTIVMVDAPGSYPWQNSRPVQENEHTISYAVGHGKVLELSEPVTDPEIFAQDVRRLLGKHNSLFTVWNGLTTIVVPYEDRSGAVRLLELVNYAADPVHVQVQVKGLFRSIRYESPEHSCCESLAPVEHDGFTEFVVPDLRIAGRIHLEP